MADAFREKRIRSPVHFPSDTQAEPLCRIFQDYRPGVDWCFAGWRNMWACLLAGMPEDELFQMILDGRSMYIQDKARRVFCSSIVGGILPIALGVAWSIKKDEPKHSLDTPRVWVFVGDMTARTGLYHEFLQYWTGHALPIRVVIEENDLSTNTPTRTVWGTADHAPWELRYHYQRTHPHVGLAERVSF